MLLGICVGVYADETSGNIDNTSLILQKQYKNVVHLNMHKLDEVFGHFKKGISYFFNFMSLN